MSEPTRFVFASDSHGDMVCKDSMAALMQYIAFFKPNLVIAGGDQYDFRSLRQNANKKETGQSLKEDIAAGNEFMRQLGRAAGKKARKVWLPGNHEARVHHIIESETNALLVERVESVWEEVETNARCYGFKEILPYHAEEGILSVGPGRWGHGYAFGAGSTVKQGLHYAPEGGFWMAGHDHTLAQVNLSKFHGGVAFSAGCLCDIPRQRYAGTRMMTSRWGNGFGAGIIDGDDYKCWLVHRVGRRWIMPTTVNFWDPSAK